MDDSQQILDELRKMTKLMSGSAGYVGAGVSAASNKGAAKDIASDLFGSKSGLRNGIEETSKSFIGVSKNVSSFGTMLMSFGVAGGVLGTLGGLIDSTTDYYRDFLSVGQSFSGSMMNMHMIATESGQGLEEFTNAVKNNATVAATLGIQRFAELGNEVRDSARQFGSFGYTVGQTNEILGDQLKTQRVLGLLDKLDRVSAAKNYEDLQNQTLGLASVTGKARDNIIKMTQELQRNSVELYGYLTSLPQETRAQVQRSVETAINVFSSLPGDVGETLSKGLTEGLAMGSAYLSSTMGEMSTMAPQVTKSLERVRKLTEAGASADEIRTASLDTVQELQNLSGAQRRNFAIFAQSGNSAAKELLAMANNVQGLRIEEMRAAADRKAQFGGAEKTFLNFGGIISDIAAQMKGLFLKLIEPALKWIMKEGGPLDKFGKWLSDLAADEGPINRFAETLKNSISELFSGDFAETFKEFETTLGNFVSSENIQNLMEKFKSAIEYFTSSEGITDSLKTVGNVLSGIGDIFSIIWSSFKILISPLQLIVNSVLAIWNKISTSKIGKYLGLGSVSDAGSMISGYADYASTAADMYSQAAATPLKWVTPSSQVMVDRISEDKKITSKELTELSKAMASGEKISKEMLGVLISMNDKSSVSVSQRHNTERVLKGLLSEAQQ